MLLLLLLHLVVSHSFAASAVDLRFICIWVWKLRLRVQKIWTVQQGVWTCRTMHRRVCGSSQLDWEEFMLFQSPGWLRLVDNSNCIFCLNHERSPLFSCWLIPASATCLWLLDILAIEKVVAGKYGAMAVSKQNRNNCLQLPSTYFECQSFYQAPKPLPQQILNSTRQNFSLVQEVLLKSDTNNHGFHARRFRR